jgi:hypothetical protein
MLSRPRNEVYADPTHVGMDVEMKNVRLPLAPTAATI